LATFTNSFDFSKMIKWIYCLLIFSPLFCYSQCKDPSYKSWNEGAITWDDFQGKPFITLIQKSYFAYYFGYEREKLRSNDTTIIRLKAYSFFVKDQSWINPDFKNETYLFYNQLIFDIIEIYRREFQNEIYKINWIYQADQILNNYLYKIDQDIEELENLTLQGNFIYVLQKRRAEIDNKLSDTKDDLKLPIHQSGTGIGAHAGLSIAGLTGSLANYFSPGFGFNFGFDFGFKNFVLYFNGNLNWNHVKQNYSEKNYWEKDTKTGIAIMEVSLGYNIINGSKFKLAPFAGISLIEISNQEIEDDELSKDFRMVDKNNLVFGMNLDFKLRKRFELIPAMNVFRENTETDLRARLYFIPVDFYPDLRGYSINLSIELNGFINIASRKKVD